ncbi:shikimate dehydrogenase family protein [Robertkochia flava]|uniref:shikimate dehydrogenase family protein n=1 Tax=Robertkochia flava TaxID=3447986 RepID=UPI001CC98ACE|nr:shikimate dehydrogenase [Robertkochia marina]
MEHRYGLIGRNIDYSFSRTYFSEKFSKLNLKDHSYVNFDLPDIDHFENVIRNTSDLCGLNVTIPYKEAVIPYLDALDPVAREIGAVNTIRISQGTLTGYNTDAYGFEHSVMPHLKTYMEHALVLGTGGASKAVVYTLQKAGIRVLQVSRNPQPGMISYADLNSEIMASHLLIVNCTPLGTFPDIEKKPDLPYQYLTSRHLLYDLIYNPDQTSFLKEGIQKGSTALNGYKMLVFQAEKAWEIWNQ